jgi:serine/threonine-protein kinase
MDKDPKLGIADTVAIGGQDGVTVYTSAGETPPAADGARAPIGGSLSRYRLTEVLGVGGMGEVVSGHDDQIGRSVAIKRLRDKDPTPEMVARFLREARVQGRLEHPAIVPVHELQYDEHGQPFFVMKQLTGTTLAAALTRPDAAAKRRKHLRAFVDVCLAIEFAHTRGVIHRDLKPANIMLGDFGEVYVLDWGIARVVDEAPNGIAFDDVFRSTIHRAGSVLGTPGYMAPEQALGDDLDGRADVYALGCILFELLALKPLHKRGSTPREMAVAPIDARASVHDLDVPPELDAICVRATQRNRDDRYPTARAVGEAVQQFLDGDRDVALRKQLAQTELEAARAALATGDGQPERQTAMQAAARALALDPTGREPADLVGRLMLQPPRDIPPEVLARMGQIDLDQLQNARKYVRVATVAVGALAPAVWLLGLRGWPVLLALAATFTVAIATYLVPRSRETAMWRVAFAGWLITLASASMTITPIGVQGWALVAGVMLAVTPPSFVRAPVLVVLVVTAGLLPWLLSLIDVLPPDFTVVGNTVVMINMADRLDPALTPFTLVGTFVAMTTIAILFVRSIVNDRRDAQRKVEIQAWQLRQLVPAHD